MISLKVNTLVHSLFSITKHFTAAQSAIYCPEKHIFPVSGNFQEIDEITAWEIASVGFGIAFVLTIVPISAILIYKAVKRARYSQIPTNTRYDIDIGLGHMKYSQ